MGRNENDGAPSPRDGHSAIWTGNEMIVWGGYSLGDDYLDTGSRFNPPEVVPRIKVFLPLTMN